jgi:hypothetical protein
MMYDQKSMLKYTATSAASLSAIAFAALVISLPLMLKEMADLEHEWQIETDAYMKLSNEMWSDLMKQSNIHREKRLADAAVISRKKKQQSLIVC